MALKELVQMWQTTQIYENPIPGFGTLSDGCEEKCKFSPLALFPFSFSFGSQTDNLGNCDLLSVKDEINEPETQKF